MQQKQGIQVYNLAASSSGFNAGNTLLIIQHDELDDAARHLVGCLCTYTVVLEQQQQLLELPDARS
jgi:hypothetical protein